MAVGQKNIVEEPLVDREKILLPPLHIKVGLIKQYVKALDKDGGCFQHICNKFPGLSYQKAKAGIFDGPQIRTLVKDINFIPSMNENGNISLVVICWRSKEPFGKP